MALVTRQEWADLCGKPLNYINTYIGRKKISVLSNKMIDTENELNKIFKKNCKKLNAAPPKETKKPTSFKEVIENVMPETSKEMLDEIFTKPETAKEKKLREAQNEEDEEKLSWDMRKKIADALKAERAAELAQLQVDKMMGALMPTELVETILRVNIQDILKTFENSCINLASIYCTILAKGDRTKLAEITGKLRIELASIVKRTEASAAQEIEGVIEEYSEARNRGERK